MRKVVFTNMNISQKITPVVRQFLPARETFDIPEIIHITYDLWSLRITLQFKGYDNPVYIEFRDIVGFRVLDEGDLIEFWNPGIRTEGWLWTVEAGGWFELEKCRPGFVSGTFHNCLHEFLVLGVDDCVSVMTSSEPRLSFPKS